MRCTYIERLKPEVRRPIRHRLADPSVHELVQLIDPGYCALSLRGTLRSRSTVVPTLTWPTRLADDVRGILGAVLGFENHIVSLPEGPCLDRESACSHCNHTDDVCLAVWVIFNTTHPSWSLVRWRASEEGVDVGHHDIRICG